MVDMGYYKNIEVEAQQLYDDELREIVEWDMAHRRVMSPVDRMRIISDEKLFARAVMLWRGVPAPMKAANHVALQTLRRDIRRREKQSMLGWVLIVVALGVGLAVLLVNL